MIPAAQKLLTFSRARALSSIQNVDDVSSIEVNLWQRSFLSFLPPFLLIFNHSTSEVSERSERT
jgi:hypothetical protein